MEVQPIFAALRKHKIPATLIVLEIALACAVFCNAVFMIGQRVDALDMPNAIDQNGLVDISVKGADPKLVNADIPRNLAALRRIPGTVGAAAVTAVPFGDGQGVDSVCADATTQTCPGADRYMFTRGAPKVLGLQLLEGRFFNGDEYADGKLDESSMPGGHVVIVTRNLAERLWPGQNAVGRQMWMGNGKYHFTVIGVIANVARPGSAPSDAPDVYYATFFPLGPNPALTGYMVRSAPRNRQRLLRAAIAKLEAMSPTAVVSGQTFTQIRDRAFANTRSMVWVLVLVCVVMLAVTAFAVMGLTSFWVGQRRRTIGIRRALGATRANILRYFQTENFLLSTLGIVIGVILALGANLYLMQHYQLDRMPWYYLLAGAIALWILGQIAVLGPALRASLVPPVVATRNI